MAWSDKAREAAAEARRRKAKAKGPLAKMNAPRPSAKTSGSLHQKQMLAARKARHAFQKYTGDLTNSPDVRAEVSAGMRNVYRFNKGVSRVQAYTKAMKAYLKSFK